MGRQASLSLRSALASIALALGGAGTPVAAAPPIDCRKALNPADREICASPEFVAMDHEIAALYDRGMAQFAGGDRHRLAMSQLAFLHQRQGCAWAAHHSAHPGVAVEECVRGAMELRVRALRDVVDRGRF